MRSKIGRPSLFAFQDIITSVIGVFIFVTMMLILSISVERGFEAADESVNISNEGNIAASALQASERENEVLKENLRRALALQKEKKILSIQLASCQTEIDEVEKSIALSNQVLNRRIQPSSLTTILQARQTALDSEVVQTLSENAVFQRDLQKARGEIEDLLKNIKKYQNSIILQGSDVLDGRREIFVVCSGADFEIVGSSGKKSFSQLREFLKMQDSKTYHIQFLCRPSSAVYNAEIFALCESLSLQYGASAILEGEGVVDERH